MPLTLTTPVASGDLDSGVSEYTQVRVSRFTCRLKRGVIEFAVEYGNTVEGTWVRGVTGRRKFEIPGDAYTTLVTTHVSNAGELTYDAVARALYEWLIAEGHYVGAPT